MRRIVEVLALAIVVASASTAPAREGYKSLVVGISGAGGYGVTGTQIRVTTGGGGGGGAWIGYFFAPDMSLTLSADALYFAESAGARVAVPVMLGFHYRLSSSAWKWFIELNFGYADWRGTDFTGPRLAAGAKIGLEKFLTDWIAVTVSANYLVPNLFLKQDHQGVDEAIVHYVGIQLGLGFFFL